MYIIFDFGTGILFHSPLDAIYDMFCTSLGKFVQIYDSIEKSKYPALGQVSSKEKRRL